MASVIKPAASFIVKVEYVLSVSVLIRGRVFLAASEGSAKSVQATILRTTTERTCHTPPEIDLIA